MPKTHQETHGNEANLSQLYRDVLGYLNFSSGKPDPSFHRNLCQISERLEKPDQFAELCWQHLQALRQEEAAFRDSDQAGRVVELVFERVLPQYKNHHADLLFHLKVSDLFQPLFLARVFESVLDLVQSASQPDGVGAAAIAQLNDFLGHRPLAVLENGRNLQPYSKERVRPIPWFIQGSGVAPGRYSEIVEIALDVLRQTPPEILRRAHFDIEQLKELAVDPRAYDFSHPVHGRPNYMFGEWDPHQIDNRGKYTRFVLRKVTLDGLMQRVDDNREEPDRLFEAGAVLAGTLLMASGISGSGPDTHDSTVTLDNLLPEITQFREAFYGDLLGRLEGARAERLRAEADQLRQPFGGVRQSLNLWLAKHRAAQLQHAQLAYLYASMGYLDAGKRESEIIPTASARMLCEIQCRITDAYRRLDLEEILQALEQMKAARAILHRAIECGAMVDPWVILGFQAQFSIFGGRANTVPDHRVDQLIDLIVEFFGLLAQIVTLAASAGDQVTVEAAISETESLTLWWDQFSSHEVSGIETIHGQEELESTRLIASALSAWRDADRSGGDVAFWAEHSEGFGSAKSFSLVVDSLLRVDDHVAAMALLMHWLSQYEAIELGDESDGFHILALQWMLGFLQCHEGDPIDPSLWELVGKFFAFLEANAEDLWQVPRLRDLRFERVIAEDPESEEPDPEEGEEESELFAAAYEGVSYRDSADDGFEGATIGEGDLFDEFPLESAGDALKERLLFLSTVARLWQIVAASAHRCGGCALERQGARDWSKAAVNNANGLAVLLTEVNAMVIPPPAGSEESLLEHDRRMLIKDTLTNDIISTFVETTLSAQLLASCIDEHSDLTVPKLTGLKRWWSSAIHLERAIRSRNANQCGERLTDFLSCIEGTPLLYLPLNRDGVPSDILATHSLQQVLRNLVQDLPRLGLIRETYTVLETARKLELQGIGSGAISEFDRLFRKGFDATIDTIARSAVEWADESNPEELLRLLRDIADRFTPLWVDHSVALRLSTLEGLDEAEWNRLREFIRGYGGELFVARHLSPASIRAVLDQGTDILVEYIEQNQDPLRPSHLTEDLGSRLDRSDVKRWIETVFKAIHENYDEYKDFNSTSIHSDYGDRFHILLHFLRLKSQYERLAWQLRPVLMVHRALARNGFHHAAHAWQGAVEQESRDVANDQLQELDNLEQMHAVQLKSVRDRLEERFVKTMAVDRMRSSIEPAMTEPGSPSAQRSFKQLYDEITAYAQTPMGTGLDVPPWLLVLEREVERIRDKAEGLSGQLERQFRLDQVMFSLAEFREQLDSWEANPH